MENKYIKLKLIGRDFDLDSGDIKCSSNYTSNDCPIARAAKRHFETKNEIISRWNELEVGNKIYTHEHYDIDDDMKDCALIRKRIKENTYYPEATVRTILLLKPKN